MDTEDGSQKQSSPSSRQQTMKQAHGAWLPAEDTRLRNAVRNHGNRWVMVAAEVGTRNGDQCAKRWSENLNPELDHSPWTPEEDEYLLRLVQTHGHNWKFMADRYLKCRAPLTLKNRYSLLMRRIKRQDNARQFVAATASESSHHKAMPSTTDPSPFAEFLPTDHLPAPDQWQSYALALSALNPTMDNLGISGAPTYNTINTGTAAGNEASLTASHHRTASQSLPTTPIMAGWGDSWISWQPTPSNSDLDLQKGWDVGDLTTGRSKSLAGTDLTPDSNAAMSGVWSSSNQDLPPVVEYSLTCQSSKLKRVLDHLVVAAMSEIESLTAEHDQVTVQLTLKA